ncbi:MalY/PatB family protein [Sulfurospirillum tamanense]|nr:PatB family C-S lyase [Sulfurospirillum tamanensis]
MFDTPIDRTRIPNEKWSRYPHDVLPAWVADMDFKAPQCVIDALHKRVEHGVFGYTGVSQDLLDTACTFIKKQYNWDVKPEWFVFVSGVVPSMNVTCKMLEPNQSVLTTTPIYPHFFKAPKMMNKEVATVPLVEKEGRWTFDFEALERAISPTCKLFLLCNPYNPGGTVFTKEELTRLGEIVKTHDLLICSDEIHADLLLDPKARHIPIASLDEDLANRTITLMAPSKTFNIAGLNCSFAIIPNETLKRRFQASIGGLNGGVNLLGLTAAKAAYEGGEAWLKELRLYLNENLLLVQEFVAKHPKLKLLDHQATFLAWIDCRALNANPHALFLEHGVGLSDGKDFLGEGFVRLNFGCPRTTLETILHRMDCALTSFA